MEKKLFGNICFTRLVKALMLSYFLTMLMLLHRLHKICSIYKALMRTSIQPGKALSKKRNLKLSVFQINPVQISNLKLAAGRRL